MSGDGAVYMLLVDAVVNSYQPLRQQQWLEQFTRAQRAARMMVASVKCNPFRAGYIHMLTALRTAQILCNLIYGEGRPRIPSVLWGETQPSRTSLHLAARQLSLPILLEWYRDMDELLEIIEIIRQSHIALTGAALHQDFVNWLDDFRYLVLDDKILLAYGFHFANQPEETQLLLEYRCIDWSL